MRLRCGQLSITGNFRENNEDACLVDSDCRYVLVADGMGGQSAGEKASQMATELVSRTLEQQIDFAGGSPEQIVKVIDRAVEYANSEIIALGQVDPNMHQMGTTIVFLVRVGDGIFVGGVGDSRCYRICEESIEQLTTDHSLTQALIDAGTITKEDAAHHRYKNVLYRYLGTKDGSNGTQAKRIDPQVGERYVLCSDGITDGVSTDEIHRIVKAEPDPQRAAEQLVAAAEKGGSKDNITCVVVDVEHDE